MFKACNIKNIYRTKKDDVENDFFIPLLKEAKIYYRGTGYFSVNALIDLSKGLIPYIKNGGKIKIVTSVCLDFEEIKLLNDSEKIAASKINEEIIKEIEECLNDECELLYMDLIANLIAANIIEIKVAYLPDGGIYHEKIGYMEDLSGNQICFIGSNNETFSGLKKNAETISVFKSWEGGFEDTKEQKDYFESLWNDNEDEVKVFDFPNAAKNKLFTKYKTSVTYVEAIEAIEKYYNHYNGKSGKKELYEYQKRAIDEFCQNKYCHFFEMATGTGKTFTAVKAIERLSSIMNGKCLYVAVVVPQIDLQVQWKREFEQLGIKTYCFGGNPTSSDWKNDFSNSIFNYYDGEKIVVGISIYDTFFSKINDQLDSYSNMNKLIVVDEAHELSANQISKLSEEFRFRLGLSATPQRYSKKETDSIINYFTRGKIDTFKYSIDEAIENNFLSRYEYHPIFVRLEDNELEFGKYQSYTKRLAVLLNEKERDMEAIKEVCNNRSIIVKKANSKTEMIQEMACNPKYTFKNSVVYCGLGKDLETEEPIIDKVTKALAFSGNYVVSQFTSKTKNRQEVLQEFEKGTYDTLVAIKCFDQGVDVPKLDKIYIMASDGLIRQTIQRRGRVLRICKETNKEIAYIYDMMTLPPYGCEIQLGASSLVCNELKRIREYARLAENKDELFDLIDNLIEEYQITEDSDDEKEVEY